ncbi:GFA family protein [Aquisalimonas sp.]|uniref:GFA family protein n=1 Tax=unclassified Aquisalimonas TaxID=2644645 RepID=UPI0025C1C552|nr:GFA family protein [Aquisalimonas sp.]
MDSAAEHRGACLCGAVSVVATVKSDHMGVCHCVMCRKWGGGPLMAVECGNAVTFQGEDQIATFSSSEWAERGFCRVCGTHLFYRLKEDGFYAIPVGLFDGDGAWTLAEEIFIDHKPAFYSFAEKTKALTGAEVFAQYSGS